MNISSQLKAEQEQILTTVMDLIRIPSVQDAPQPDAPFGPAVKQALHYLLEKGRRDGFTVKNADNYGGHIDFPGATDEILAITGHLDVVPGGDPSSWTTPPFEPSIRNNRVYGRGSLDDKGPMATAYHVMKVLKESGYRPQKTIRLIIGCDEETNWDGMRYYLKREKAPDCGFSPDADFPVIHGEKGLLFAQFSVPCKPLSQADGVSIQSFQGGSAANMVPDHASVTLSCSSKKDHVLSCIQTYCRCHQTARITVDKDSKNDLLTVHIRGTAAHGSTPEQGENAISIAMDLLAELPLTPSPIKNFIQFYQEHLGFDFYGQRLGKRFHDEVSGDLITNPGLLTQTDQTLTLTVNFRYPVTAIGSDLAEQLKKIAASYDIAVSVQEDQPPLFYPRESPLVQALLDAYRRHSGHQDAQPLVIGGATYARAIPNTLAFGIMFPGDKDLCHQADEYVSIDRLMCAAHIYADAIQILDQMDTEEIRRGGEA